LIFLLDILLEVLIVAELNFFPFWVEFFEIYCIVIRITFKIMIGFVKMNTVNEKIYGGKTQRRNWPLGAFLLFL